MMEIHILTIFPKMFECFLSEGVIGRAVSRKIVKVFVHNLRDFTNDKHRTVDDEPYGGGPGMVLKPEPIFRAYRHIEGTFGKPYTIATEPWGELFDQKKAQLFSQKERLLIICGRYEGVDERVKTLVDEEISIGNYVLSGGELPAMVIVDAVARLIPGVLGCSDSLKSDSFYEGLLGYPNYTRPADFEGLKVPEVLLSGNHREIEKFRRLESLRRTLEKRPEMLKKLFKEKKLSEEDIELLKSFEKGRKFLSSMTKERSKNV